jgi:transcriptional regulator with XRE-family HTH domain
MESIDLIAMMRAVRRQAGLSQRELAERAGVPKSTVARIESGSTTNPRFRIVERLVQAAGGELAVRDHSDDNGDGRDGVTPAVPHDRLRDTAGRRYPAHLDLRAEFPMLGLDRQLLPAGTPVYTFELDRDDRDERRAKEAPASTVRVERVDDVPEGNWAWVARTADDGVVGQLTAWVWPNDVVAVLPSADAALCRLSIDPGWQLIGLEQRLLSQLRETLATQGIREIVTFGYRGWEAAYLSELGFHPRLRTITAFTLSAAAGELFR